MLLWGGGFRLVSRDFLNSEWVAPVYLSDLTHVHTPIYWSDQILYIPKARLIETHHFLCGNLTGSRGRLLGCRNKSDCKDICEKMTKLWHQSAASTLIKYNTVFSWLNLEENNMEQFIAHLANFIWVVPPSKVKVTKPENLRKWKHLVNKNRAKLLP